MSPPETGTSPVAGLSAEDAAAHWMVERDKGLDLAADPGFRAWLEASGRNAEAWARAEQAWDEFDDLDDPFLDAMRQDALQARGTPRIAPVWMAAASLAIVLAGAGLLAWRLLPGKAAPGGQVEVNARPDYVTARGAQATYTLADGSQVTLDSGSAVAVRYSAGRRAVRLLYGQAYFRVVHDTSRPFVTAVGDRTVTDLGTEFDLRLDGSAVSVVLASGSVSVGEAAPSAATVVLKPGQRLDAAPGTGVRVEAVDLEQALAWRTGYLEFRDETLSAALAEMARYGGAPVVVTDPKIGALKVSGRFKTGDPARFVETLAQIYPLRTRPRADGGMDILAR